MSQSVLYEDAEQVVANRAAGYAPDDADGFRMVTTTASPPLVTDSCTRRSVTSCDGATR